MRFFAMAGLFALAGLHADPAFAHAHLTQSQPDADSVGAPPKQVVLGFTEELEPRFCTVHVTGADGKRADTGQVRMLGGDEKRLVIDLRTLPPGRATVVWHATSTDTHQTDGTFHFTVTQ